MMNKCLFDYNISKELQIAKSVCSIAITYTHRAVSPGQQCVFISHRCTQYPSLVQTLKY